VQNQDLNTQYITDDIKSSPEHVQFEYQGKRSLFIACLHHELTVAIYFPVHYSGSYGVPVLYARQGSIYFKYERKKIYIIHEG
jgi:hypothetical protein